MNLRGLLLQLAEEVAAEAQRNPEFGQRLQSILASCTNERPEQQASSISKPRGGRRALARIDPIEVAKLGDAVLRDELGALTLEELRDVVAQFGMDPSKLVMKWKDRGRVVDRIVELALTRITKGDAFA